MNMQPNQIAEQAAPDFPSLSFRVNKDFCSITASCVSAIMLMPERVVRIPEMPRYCKGIIHLRGQVIPLVDMRVLFNLPTMEEEYFDFCNMLDLRKQDHINWVTELERCMETDEKFRLATDHHQCALGKWHDNFHSENTTVNFHLRKLNEPHEKFHEVSKLYNTCVKDHENCKRDVCLKRRVEAARDEYMPVILSLLDAAKEVFLSSFQSIVIVIEGAAGTIGLVADQVHSVETVVPIDQEQSSAYFAQSRFVTGIAKIDKTEKTLLQLDEEALLQLCEGLKY